VCVLRSDSSDIVITNLIIRRDGGVFFVYSFEGFYDLYDFTNIYGAF